MPGIRAMPHAVRKEMVQKYQPIHAGNGLRWGTPQVSISIYKV